MLTNLEKYLGKGKVRQNVQLAPVTTFKVGGPAEFYFEAQSDSDLVQAIKASHDLHIPMHVFGGISNVIIGSDGLKGLVIKNLIAYKKTIEEKEDYCLLRVSGGYNMTRLAKETAEFGYEGLEYHLGLPGTVGGGLCVNSGWYAHPPSKYIGDPVHEVCLISKDGATRIEPKEYFHFDYDYSVLKKTGEIVLWVDFKLKKADPEELFQHGREALDYRKKTQPFGIPSSGCYFQNIDGKSAGRIIDQAGLKGYTIGGAQVSTIHANFIVNTGHATSEDVQKLAQHVKETVKTKFGIHLEEEIIWL